MHSQFLLSTHGQTFKWWGVFLLIVCGGLLFLSSTARSMPARKTSPTKETPHGAHKHKSSIRKSAARRRRRRRRRKPKKREIELVPIAPLPTVYRDVRVESIPSNRAVQLQQGNKALNCVPANRTPCKVRVIGYGRIQINIQIRHQGRDFRYLREVKGRAKGLERWLLELPKVPPPPRRTTVLVPTKPSPRTVIKRRTPPPQSTPRRRGVPVWAWVVGGTVVVGAAVGIAVAVSRQDHVGLRCIGCAP